MDASSITCWVLPAPKKSTSPLSSSETLPYQWHISVINSHYRGNLLRIERNKIKEELFSRAVTKSSAPILERSANRRGSNKWNQFSFMPLLVFVRTRWYWERERESEIGIDRYRSLVPSPHTNTHTPPCRWQFLGPFPYQPMRTRQQRLQKPLWF